MVEAHGPSGLFIFLKEIKGGQAYLTDDAVREPKFLIDFEVQWSVIIMWIVVCSLSSLSNAGWLNFKTNYALMTFNCVVDEHSDVQVVVNHYQVIKGVVSANGNTFKIIWRQVPVQLVAHDHS